MATQSNRSTADIFYYTIRDKVEYQSDPDNCDVTKYYYNDDSYDSKYEFAKDLFRSKYSKNEIHRMLIDYAYSVSYRWENKQMFLTETDADFHLKTNHYHYSPDAHVYVCHAWRATELLTFFKNLFEYFEIEKKFS